MQIFYSSVINVLSNYKHLINAQYSAALKYVSRHNTIFFIFTMFSVLHFSKIILNMHFISVRNQRNVEIKKSKQFVKHV